MASRHVSRMTRMKIIRPGVSPEARTSTQMRLAMLEAKFNDTRAIEVRIAKLETRVEDFQTSMWNLHTQNSQNIKNLHTENSKNIMDATSKIDLVKSTITGNNLKIYLMMMASCLTFFVGNNYVAPYLGPAIAKAVVVEDK